jgi:hypothetical protein
VRYLVVVCVLRGLVAVDDAVVAVMVVLVIVIVVAVFVRVCDAVEVFVYVSVFVVVFTHMRFASRAHRDVVTVRFRAT